jgi:CheY-like chemotaxis protein
MSIFEAFQQADGTTSRKYGGTGLGLSISREIARLLGGSIAVTSETGRSSAFTLYLPDLPAAIAAGKGSGLGAAELARPDRERPPGAAPPLMIPQSRAVPGAAEVEPGVLSGTTVLVVDDDVRNVFALTSALELHGIRVLYADNGREAIRLLHRHPEVNLVLMDVMMPDMDGNETAAAIRRTPQFAELPILFLTAKAMPGDREKSIAAGASDYITKPVDLDRLLAVMRSWVAATAGRSGARAGGEAPA